MRERVPYNPKRGASVPPLPDPRAVFLNIPYDAEFTPLYTAYIVGLCQLGLDPHLTLEIPGGARRLDKIFELIQRCQYSIHDLSRVEVSPAPIAVPRFNMPLELGMTITWQRMNPNLHEWYVWESKPYRIQLSTSDLNGTDACIHGGEAEGVMREIRNTFQRDPSLSMPEMLDRYRFVHSNLDTILKRNGTRNPYDRSVFNELCLLSSGLALLLRRSEPPV